MGCSSNVVTAPNAALWLFGWERAPWIGAPADAAVAAAAADEGEAAAGAGYTSTWLPTVTMRVPSARWLVLVRGQVRSRNRCALRRLLGGVSGAPVVAPELRGAPWPAAGPCAGPSPTTSRKWDRGDAKLGANIAIPACWVDRIAGRFAARSR